MATDIVNILIAAIVIIAFVLFIISKLTKKTMSELLEGLMSQKMYKPDIKPLTEVKEQVWKTKKAQA